MAANVHHAGEVAFPVSIPAAYRAQRANAAVNLSKAHLFGYRPRLFDPLSGIPTQVVNPSVSRATSPQGTALTDRVDTPSGPTTFKPGPTLDSCSGPTEYGFGEPEDAEAPALPLGAGSLERGGEPSTADGFAEGSEIGGGPARGGGSPIVSPSVLPGITGACWARTADDKIASGIITEKEINRIESSS